MAVPGGQTSSAPAQPDPATAAVAPPTPSGDGQAPASASIDDTTLFARLAELPPDEIVAKLPSLQGRIGSLAQQQARQLAEQERARLRAEQAERDAAAAAENRRRELRRLAQEDPDKLAEATLEDLNQQELAALRSRESSQTRAQIEANLRAQIQAVYDQPLVREVWDSADEQTRARLWHESYPTFDAFVAGVADVVGDHKATKKAQELAKQQLAAMQKAAKIEGFGQQPTEGADLGTDGAAPGGRIWSDEDVAKMDLQTYRKYKAEIRAQELNGTFRRTNAPELAAT